MQKKDWVLLAEAFHASADKRQLKLARDLSNNIQLMQGWLHAAIYTPRYRGIKQLLHRNFVQLTPASMYRTA